MGGPDVVPRLARPSPWWCSAHSCYVRCRPRGEPDRAVGCPAALVDRARALRPRTVMATVWAKRLSARTLIQNSPPMLGGEQQLAWLGGTLARISTHNASGQCRRGGPQSRRRVADPFGHGSSSLAVHTGARVMNRRNGMQSRARLGSDRTGEICQGLLVADGQCWRRHPPSRKRRNPCESTCWCPIASGLANRRALV